MIFLAIFALLFITLHPVTGASVARVNFTQAHADKYLSKFGYMDLLPTGTKSGSAGQQLEQKRQDTRKNALKLFQQFAGLPVTGKLDDKTIKRMRQPRCGRKDVINTSAGLRDSTSETGFIYKWDKSTLQWTVKQSSGQLDPDRVRGVLGQALEVWSKVAPLDFMEVNPQSEPELQVSFGGGQHGDYWPFDGPGNVLAHASYPKDGRLHFDEDEKWVIDNPSRLLADPDSIDLYSVAVHEIGHALGVMHLQQPDSIMYPIYMAPFDDNGIPKEVKLSRYDIEAIQKLYGPRTPGKRTTARPGAALPTTIRPQPRPAPPTDRPVERPVPTAAPTGGTCPSFQAAVTATDGATYFFNGNSAWKKTNAESGSTTSIRYIINQLFPGSPTNGLTAAVITPILQLTLLFQGSRVFGYSWSPSTKKFTMQEGYPKTLPENLPFVPQGVVQWRDGNLVLYKGDRFFIWDHFWNTADFNGKVSDYFHNMPYTAKTSFGIGNKIYLLNGTTYQIYDMDTQEIGNKRPVSTLITC